MEIKSQFGYFGKTYQAHWVEDNPLKNFPADKNWTVFTRFASAVIK
jgi:hypothetical protein